MKTVFIAAFHFVFIAAAAFGGQGLLYRQPAEDSPSGWERQSLPVGCGHFGANVFGLIGDERVQVTHNADLTLALEREMCTGGGGFMLIVACDSAAKRKIRRILETGSPIKDGRFYDLSLSLQGISPVVSPDLLKVLAEMGHGDEIVFLDAHFPAHTFGREGAVVLRADGIRADALLKGVTPVG